eukprot:scaffold4796_cov169-Ochromonas_danica.AAC.1
MAWAWTVQFPSHWDVCRLCSSIPWWWHLNLLISGIQTLDNLLYLQLQGALSPQKNPSISLPIRPSIAMDAALTHTPTAAIDVLATLLRAYMDMLTTRDNSYGHVSFQRAFRGAVSILLHVVKEEFANLHGTDRLLDFVNSYLVTAIGRDSLPQQQQQQVLAGLKALQVADKAAVVQARCADISTREDN